VDFWPHFLFCPLSLLPPRVPKRFVIEDAAYYLDGGTTIIEGTDERGRRGSIGLTQQKLPRLSWLSLPIGRLYVGGRIVSLHSQAEAAVLAVLEEAVKELRGRPPEQPPPPSAEAPGLGRPGATIIFGNPDLAELAQLNDRRVRLIWMAEYVIEYVRLGAAL
jgi:hypothetical protein